MKHLFTTCLSATLILITSTLIGCNNSSHDDYPVYYLDIVTCLLQPDSTVHFEQVLRNDQGSVMLYPEPPIKLQAYNGQRALLQYYITSSTPDSNHNIAVSQVAPVRHDTIARVSIDSIAAYPNDPVKIVTAWRTGTFLNLDLNIEYYHKAHRLDLFYHPTHTSTDTLNVILRHDNNGDALGYWITAYASFYIPQLHTYKAARIYANMDNEALPYTIINLK